MWTAIGIVASVLAIFSFITGITSLRQLYRAVRPHAELAARRFIALTSKHAQMAYPSKQRVVKQTADAPGSTHPEWRRLTGRMKVISVLFGLSLVSAVVGAKLLPEAIPWALMPVGFAAPSGLVAGTIVAGAGYTFVVAWLRRRDYLDREEAAMLCTVPIVGLALVWMTGSLGRSFSSAVAGWLVSSTLAAVLFATLTFIELAVNFRHRNEP